MSSQADDKSPIVRANAVIANKRGLHARASAKFVETAARFPCEVSVTRGENTVSARSIMGLMMLGAAMGVGIELTAQGPEAEAAIAALVALIAAKFHEEA